MKKYILTLLYLSIISTFLFSQTPPHSCAHEHIYEQMLEVNPNIQAEMDANETFIQARVAKIYQDRLNGKLPKGNTTYIIPVVLHVFHNGEDAFLDMEQLQSGLDIINNDFNGLNADWDDIDPNFDGIKASLDIQLCLASIDPDGNSTTGVVYYDNENAMLNNENLYEYAWDNYKYLNIYLPKYTNGKPSIFTAYANYPSTFLSDSGSSGITYSSIRWGYGNHSELEEGQEWASVGTHEMGHWLDLRHTFENGCSFAGDGIDDTPPTTGGTIFLESCYNNDLSCGVATNGSNYMDYNHDCKKMFTQGQVDRMTAALELPSRITIWSQENLMATGCAEEVSTVDIEDTKLVKVAPNPARDLIRFSFTEPPLQFLIFDGQGRLIREVAFRADELEATLALGELPAGLYYYHAVWKDSRQSGRFSLL